ncbi:MAG: c-type cytochrome biogenesis protein CcmI [Quisquiliibacterium sp.]
MIWFWLVIAALACAATATLVLPLLRSGRRVVTPSGSDEHLRLAIYRDRRAEIENERLAGRLTDDEAARAQEELLDEAAVQFREPQDAAPHVRRSARPTLIAALVALVLPLAAVFVYALIGSPSLVAMSVAELRGEISGESLDRTIAELQKRVGKAPEDGEAWAMLGQAHRMAGNIPPARQALERAIALRPGDARITADYAEILVMSADGNFSGRPFELLERALQLDPDDEKAIALMAAAQYRRGDRAQALRYMRKLAANMPPGSHEAQRLGEVITKIESEIAASAQSSATVQPASPQAATAVSPASGKRDGASPPPSGAIDASAISGRIQIDDALRAQAVPGTTLFVVARGNDGSRIPLAALRLAVGDWPLEFSLGDAQAMNPQRLISKASGVVIEARISRSGTAGRQSGDLFGTSAEVGPGAREVLIRIDQRVP